MTANESPKRISGPVELLQAIPYLLGFHPASSLVVVGLRDAMLVVTARLDLADCVPALVADVMGTLQRGGSTSLVAAVYDDPGGQRQDGAVRGLDEVREAVERAAGDTGCELAELLLVSGGRWRSMLCRLPGCCPPQGRALPDDVSAFAADAAIRGVVALPDRATLERTLDPLAHRAALLPGIRDAEQHAVAAVLRGDGARRERAGIRALFAAARAAAVPRRPELDDAEVARFGVDLAGRPVRDAVWLGVDDRRLDGRPLWRDLGRRLPAPYDAPALFLFGWAAWRAGDGALAGIAAERAVASDPTCSAARLLLSALDHGLDPRSVPQLRSSGPLGRLARSA